MGKKRETTQGPDLNRILAEVYLRMKLYHVSQERKTLREKHSWDIRELNGHETRLIMLLGALDGGKEWLNINDLQAQLGNISQGTMSSVVGALLKDGFIQKRVPTNKPGYSLVLTQRGFNKYEEVLSNITDMFKGIIDGFSILDKDREVIMRCFQALIVHYDQVKNSWADSPWSRTNYSA